MTQETLFDRFGDSVIDTPEKNAEVQHWAFESWENPPDDELACRDMYLKVFDCEIEDTFNPHIIMSNCLVAASLAAGKRHAVVPLQMMDLYLSMLNDDDFKAVIQSMISLISSCALAQFADSQCVQVQQELMYWLAYSTVIERIPFGMLDILKGINMPEPKFSNEDIEYIQSYKALYALVPDFFMMESVREPAYFFDPDSSDEEDWEDEGWDEDDWEDEDEWAENNSPTLMDAIREDEAFDR